MSTPKRVIRDLAADFCAAWERQPGPSIECFLEQKVNQHGEDVRFGLFAYLLDGELSRRRHNFPRPTPEEYEGRFPPQYHTIIAKVFEDYPELAWTGSPLSVIQPQSAEKQPNIDDVRELIEILRRLTAPADGRIGKFRIKNELGRGAFGIVLHAYDELLNRDVALKIPSPEAIRKHPSHVRSLLIDDESRRQASLDHRGIVRVLDLCWPKIDPTLSNQALVQALVAALREKPEIFIVMEFVEGISLAERLESGPLPQREAANILVQTAQAVRHAHVQHPPLIHRDLKPGNILLTKDGKPKVADFGLAVPYNAQDLGASAGTMAYMAPEQLNGAVEPRSDQWSLGVIGYQLLTGRNPFDPDHVGGDWPTNIRCLPHLAAREVNGEVSEALSQALDRCLQKDPTNRYPTLADLLVDLKRAKATERRLKPISAHRRTLDNDILDQRKEFSRHESFTPRPHCAEHVERLLADAGTISGYALFTGGHGEGKSAFVAYNVQKSIKMGGQPVYHFVRRTDPGWDDPERMLRSLAAQLIRKYGIHVNPALYGRLKTSKSDRKRIIAAAGLFADVLQRVSNAIPCGTEKEVIWIDGLDEAFGPTGRHYDDPGLRGLLPPQLPPSIYMVLTSEPGNHLDWLTEATVCHRFCFEDECVANKAHTNRYLSERATDVNPPLTPSYIARVAERCQGNLYIAVQQFAEIKRNPLARRDPDAIPRNVYQHHAAVFSRIVARAQSVGIDRRDVRFVLGLLAEAREPLSSDQLDNFGVHNATDEILDWATEFFRSRPPLRDPHLPFEFNNISIPEFLVSQLTSAERQRIHAHLATACGRWFELDGYSKKYAVRYLPDHLAASGRWGELLDVLCSPELDYLTEWVEKGNGDKGLPCLIGLVNWLKTADPATTAGLATQIGRIYSLRGEYAKAKEWFERAVATCSANVGRKAQAIALHELGSLYLYSSDLNAATSCYRRALARCIGDDGNELYSNEVAANYIALATVAQRAYRFDEAIKLAEIGQHKAQNVEDYRHVIAAKRLIAVVYNHQGALGAAERIVQEGLALAKAYDAAIEMPGLLTISGWIHYEEASFRNESLIQATQSFEDALNAAQGVCDFYSLVEANLGLGCCALVRRETKDAELWLKTAADTLRREKHPELRTAILLGKACIAHQTGALDRADAYYRRIVAGAEKRHFQGLTCRALVGLGAVQWHLGHTGEAQSNWHEAMRKARSISLERQRLTEFSIALCKSSPTLTPR